MPMSPMRETARQMRRDGLPLSRIAEACGVTKACVSMWCRAMPEHHAATRANTAAALKSRRLYPEGTRRLVGKLLAAGVPAHERLRIAREAAAASSMSLEQLHG